MKYFTVFTLFLSETGNKDFPDTLYTLDKIMNLIRDKEFNLLI